MKYNISDILENLDVEETEKIADSIKINQSEADIDEIKKRVIPEAEIIKENGNKKRKLSVKTIIALAAAIAVILCSITVGAEMYFEPASSFNKIFSFKNKDNLIDSMGWNVDFSCESNGYELRLTQVMSDNTTFYIAFDCPRENKTVWVPNQADERITFDGKELTNGTCSCFIKEDGFVLVVTNYDTVKNNTKVKIEINKLGSYFAADTDEIIDILRSQGYTDEEIEDLVSNNEYGLAYALGIPEETIEGSWSFEFNTIETDLKKDFEYDGLVYAGNHALPLKITKADISPLAVHLEFIETDGVYSADRSEESLVIEMKDGTVYTDYKDSLDEGSVSSWHGTTGEKLDGNMNMYFKNIINVDDVKTISLGGTVIYEG